MGKEPHIRSLIHRGHSAAGRSAVYECMDFNREHHNTRSDYPGNVGFLRDWISTCLKHGRSAVSLLYQ
ncbi:MAG TPA: hypothetical protein PLV88_07690, partial [Methanoregulaceae archaeon]|nr:hypothetical protein [Methanoregulaceae archaeon]